MDDVTANNLKKANLIRTNLLLVTYTCCRKSSLARKSFKINSRSLEELSSLYESQEIIINNPLEIGKPNTSEGQEMIFNSSRHSSNKSLTKVMLSPMNEELYTDTKTFIAYLDRKKIVFSAQKLKIKQNSSNEITSISKSVIEEESKSTCCTSIKEKCNFECEKMINKSCKFLRTLAKTYKNYQLGNHRRHKSNIDSEQKFSISNQNSHRKPIPKHPSKHAKNQSCALVSKYVDISTIDEIEEMHPPRKSFCVDSKISFLSTNDIRELLKAPKKNKYNKANFNVNNNSLSSFSPTKKKKKSFKKLFTLNTPNIKKKIYQIFGKCEKKENYDNDTLELKRGNYSENLNFSSRERNKSKTYQKESA